MRRNVREMYFYLKRSLCQMKSYFRKESQRYEGASHARDGTPEHGRQYR